ncbi:MAG: cobalamin-dependent protein [Candidatus Helarchaeota archaeon]
MKEYDIIFIHPPRVMKRDYSKYAKFVRSTFMFIPMGVFAIADFLEREGFAVKMINYPLEQFFNRNWTLENYLKNIEFKICAIDFHWVLNAHGAIEVSKVVKRVNPNAKIVLGGFSASYYHDQILKFYDTIDGVIKGEGEIPLLEYVKKITRNLPVESVPNLSYKNSSNHIKINPILYVADSLDDLNFSNISLLNNARKYFELSRQIMGIGFAIPNGRGCIFNCPCCGGGREAQKLLNRRQRVTLRSPEKIIEDLHNVIDNFNVRCIFFGHGTYPATFKYWKKLFKLMRREKFDVGGDLEIWRLPFPKEMWKEFFATFVRKQSSISVSPRTLSVKVQQKIAKVCDPTFNFPKNQIQDLIKNANLFRITLRMWLTLGFPFQNWSDILSDYLYSMKNLVKYSKSKNQPIIIMNEPFYISPGSPAHEAPEKFEIKLKYKYLPEIAKEFERTRVSFGNRVLNYDSKHFSRATIRIMNLAFFLNMAPMFITDSSIDTEKDKRLRFKILSKAK